MLVGHYQTKIDLKNRTAVPAKYRQVLGKKVVLAQWYENCLVIVSKDQWEALLEQIAQKSFIVSPARETDRFLLGNAFEIDLDSQGRFVVPPTLTKYAGLNSEVVFIGLLNRVEIWDKNNWDKHQKYLNEKAAEIAEALSKAGDKS